MNYDEKTRYPHRYGADLRPPGWECLPPRIAFSTFPNETFRHGEVQTERPLTADECRSYELIPISDYDLTATDLTNTLMDAVNDAKHWLDTLPAQLRPYSVGELEDASITPEAEPGLNEMEAHNAALPEAIRALQSTVDLFDV